MRTPTTFAALAASALLLAGCGGEAEAEPTPSATATPSASARVSEGPTSTAETAGSDRILMEYNAFFEPDDPESYADDVTAWMRIFGPSPADLIRDVTLPSILEHELTRNIYEVGSGVNLELAVIAEPTDVSGRVGCRIRDINANEVLAFEKSEPGEWNVTCSSTAP